MEEEKKEERIVVPPTEPAPEQTEHPVVLRKMDSCQICMIETSNRELMHKLIAKPFLGIEFKDDKSDLISCIPKITLDPDHQTAKYPLSYVLAFLKLTKENKATHILISVKKNKPIRMLFRTADVLAGTDGDYPEVDTIFWLAPRIDRD